jgi:hypothetical protein
MARRLLSSRQATPPGAFPLGGTFQAKGHGPMDETETPEHLRQLPEEVVAELTATIISEVPHMPRTLGLELQAFAESRTVHDARRVARALRHAYGRPGLAQEIEDRLS